MNRTKFISSATGIVFATVFTFSCSSGEESGSKDFCPLTAVSDNSVTCGGQTYRTVKIGELVWFAENLNYKVKGSSCYGEIGKVITEDYDTDNNTFISKTLEPQEVQANCVKYGRLYDWATAMGLEHPKCNRVGSCTVNEKHQGICPEGWRIPSKADWEELLEAVGGYRTAGAHLKEKASWDNCDFSFPGNLSACEDTYDFSARPGGYGYSGGDYNKGNRNGYWQSTYNGDHGLTNACHIDNMNSSTICETDVKSNLYSVRCVKDFTAP